MACNSEHLVACTSLSGGVVWCHYHLKPTLYEQRYGGDTARLREMVTEHGGPCDSL